MKRLALVISLITVVTLLASCGTAESEVIEKEVTRVVQETIVETVMVEGTSQTVQKQVTRVVEVEKVVTATPEPELGPAVGGTLYYVLGGDPDTLDPQLSTGGAMYQVSQFLGGSLIAKDPETGEYIPYLAESWTVAEDGLSYDFKLKEDIKFHDGTPLTAHDFVWTFERAMAPGTMSAATAAMLQGVVKAEAVDDYTLRLKTAWANYYLLENLTDPVFFQPLSQAYVEQTGELYGRQPLGVGPFKFKEWVTDEKIVIGYGYNLDKARALMAEAGYIEGSDGVWQKDGQPLTLGLKVPSDSPGHVKLAPVLQQQLKELGVDVELELVEFGVLDPQYSQGAYNMGLINFTYSNSGLLYAMYHSGMVGSLNASQVRNTDLDEILETMGFTTDSEVNQQAANEAQRLIVEQAYIIPLYTPKIPYTLNNRVKDAVFSPITGALDLFDAYIEAE